jgi:hypothetical protein
MGGESEAAWRALLDDLVKRGLKTPELVIVDGAPGLDAALSAPAAASLAAYTALLMMCRSGLGEPFRADDRSGPA